MKRQLALCRGFVSQVSRILPELLGSKIKTNPKSMMVDVTVKLYRMKTNRDYTQSKFEKREKLRNEIQYSDKEMEHKVVKRNGTLWFSPFYSQCSQVIQCLINTTSSHGLPFKIYANKFDLESLNVLILDGLQTPPKLCFFAIFF